MMASEPIAAGAPVAVSADGERVEAHATKHPILVAGEDLDAGAEVLIGEDGIALAVRVAEVSPTAETEPAPAERRSLLDYPAGLHDMPAAHYYARIKGVANKGALDKIHKSPATYQAWVTGADEEDSPALAFGRALHSAILEPAIFAATYTTEPDFGDCRKADNKRTRDAWRADNAGKTFLSAADAERIAGMSRAVREHPVAGQLFDGGTAEVTVKWTDPTTGLVCKARADYYKRGLGVVVDLKSTTAGDDKTFAKSVASYGYHRQAAFYGSGFEAVGAPFKIFVFVAVEKEAPYLVSLFTLDDDASRKGAESIRADLDTLAACLAEDEWPGYPTEIQTLSLPPWAA
jgi:hypothetical protein